MVRWSGMDRQARVRTATSPRLRTGYHGEPMADRAKIEPSAKWQEVRARRALLTTTEGHILLTGLALAFLYFGWLGWVSLSSLRDSQVLLALTATHTFFGRAAGIAFGYASGFGHAIVIPANLAIETIILMLFYPLFVFTWRHLFVSKGFKSFMERVQEAAEANQAAIRRYGIPGLFLFVFIPFWMTGPLVGCVIGFLLGLRPWVNMSVVLSGTYVANIVWAMLLKQLNERLAAYGSLAPMVLVGAIIVIVVVSNIILRDRTK